MSRGAMLPEFSMLSHPAMGVAVTWEVGTSELIPNGPDE